MVWGLILSLTSGLTVIYATAFSGPTVARKILFPTVWKGKSPDPVASSQMT
jgi:hypothetical protein